MSYRASDWAMAQPLDNPAAKLVLLILAHHMNHKTGRCFPSVATMARESGLSDRGVRLAVARLAKLGLVELRGSTTRRHYRLNVATAAHGAEVSRETAAPDAGVVAATPAALAATPARGAGHSGTPCRLTGKEPVNNREGENAPPPQGNAVGMKAKTPGKPDDVASSRATRLAADWQPSAQGIAFARREHADIDWQREARAFRDYWLAKPDGLSADWEASWRRWLGRAAQFALPPSKPQRRGGGGDGLAPDELWLARVIRFRDARFWSRVWGARPGEEGCHVPADMLRQFGYPVYERGQRVPPLQPSAGGSAD